MNWDRKELKAKGKAAYKANRMTCIIAALLLMLVTGGFSAGSSVGSSWNTINNSTNNEPTYDYEYDYDDISGGMTDLGVEDPFTEAPSPSSLIAPAIIAAVMVVVLIAAAFGAAIGIFLLNPLQVGLRKFFRDNAGNPSTGLDRTNVGMAFHDSSYMKIVGSMFTTGLFTFFWALLMIIPGIYKAYCWRLVPYIISEDPSITGKEARARSAEMMYGSKWASFVLDLSFLGWKLLGLLTLGILNLVFTNPYQAATDAELYLALSGGGTEVKPEAAAAPAVDAARETVEFVIDQEGMDE